MSVDVAHLVFVAFCYAGDEVSDDRLDCSESSDILAAAVVDFDLDDVGLGLRYWLVAGMRMRGSRETNNRECDGDVRQVLGELATGALDGDNATPDVDFDVLRDDDLLG